MREEPEIGETVAFIAIELSRISGHKEICGSGYFHFVIACSGDEAKSDSKMRGPSPKYLVLLLAISETCVVIMSTSFLRTALSFDRLAWVLVSMYRFLMFPITLSVTQK